MTGESQHSSEAVAWRRALQEADGALVCLQAGWVQQATAHLARGEAALTGQGVDEPALEMGQGTDGWRDRLAARRRLRALTRALARHPHCAAAIPQSPPDRLGRHDRIKALAGGLGFVILVLLFHPDTAPPEQRSVGAISPDASTARVSLTLDELKARFPDGVFSHMSHGVRFGQQVEVRLGASTPLFKLNISLRNSMIHRVTLLHGEIVRHSFLLGPRAIPVGLLDYEVDLRETAAPRGVDTIRVQGVDGDGSFELGPIRFKDWN